MLLQTRFCGYCNCALLLDEDEHYCIYREDFDAASENFSYHYPFHYSATAFAEAEAFLIANPEFKEHQNLLYSNRIGAYDSPEEQDFQTPINYDVDYHPIEEPFLTEVTREEEWSGIYSMRDNYQREQITYWKDVEPTRCTSATWYWSNKPGAYGDPLPYAESPIPHIRVRNQRSLFTLEPTYEQRYQGLDYNDREFLDPATALEFEELQGFASETLIDLNITERYAFRFFNIYRGKDHNLHVGLLTIEEDKVRCTRGDCYFRLNPKPIPDTTDRSIMESFIHDIIRHGNNHGPDWYLRREDFAFIHSESCDTYHDRFAYCNNNSPKVPLDLTTLDGNLGFIIRHRKFCRDTRCRCTAYYHTFAHYLRERTLQSA